MLRRFMESLLGKMIVLSLGVSLIPIGVVGFLAYNRGHEALEASVFERLEALSEAKKAAVEVYFVTLAEEIQVVSHLESLHHVLDQLKEADAQAAAANAPFDVTSETYKAVHAASTEAVAAQIGRLDLANVYLVCPQHGHVLYELHKDPDLGADLRNGQWRDTALARVWSRVAAERTLVFSDYAPHAPLNNAITMFAGAPVVDQETGAIEAVLVVRLSPSHLESLVDDRTGLGETGESYLVGKDLLMRSQSHFEKEASVLRTRVDTQAVRTALGGQHGHDLLADYRGVEVLSAWEPMDLLKQTAGLEWVIVSEVDQAEAFRPIEQLARIILALAAVVALLVIFVAWLAARRVTIPLRRQRDEIARSAETLGAASSQITSSVSELAASQIMASAKQQALGMDQTASSMESIKQASAQNAAGTRQLQDASNSLKGVGETLKALVAAHKL
jgi:methyl-accepting chemotaxis protein